MPGMSTDVTIHRVHHLHCRYAGAAALRTGIMLEETGAVNMISCSMMCMSLLAGCDLDFGFEAEREA